MLELQQQDVLLSLLRTDADGELPPLSSPPCPLARPKKNPQRRVEWGSFGEHGFRLGHGVGQGGPLGGGLGVICCEWVLESRESPSPCLGRLLRL